MKTPTVKLNGKGARSHNRKTGDAQPLVGPVAPPSSGPIFDPSNIELQHRMRFNPLRMVDPENLSVALDQFDLGILRQATLLWDAMIKRDDTLSFVVPQLENAIAAKPWGVFRKKGVDEAEAARHAAALQYFYDNVTAVDAYDRNVRGDRHLLLKQMGSSFAMRYAAHHFVWKPSPGKTIDVDGAAPVPALSAELELVPLWFFENVSGTLRFLPFGGFGINGQDLNWDGEWMCTTGPGMMFGASITYMFKRLGFQDWTIFNERYALPKVVGKTNAKKGTDAGNAMEEVVNAFNGDGGITIHECPPGSEPPIELLGPEGSMSVDLFERFLDRQDRKMAVMFRGSDLRNMSREKDTTGVSAQSDETEALEMAHCQNIASACRTFIDAAVIKYCFGEGVEPLAYFGLPDMDEEDSSMVIESAGFLADRGAPVLTTDIAERLGVTLGENPPETLQSLTSPNDPADGGDPVLKREIAYDQYKKGGASANAGAKLHDLVATALQTANGDTAGRWVTIEGRHVLIGPNGEILEGHLRGKTNHLSEDKPSTNAGKKSKINDHGNRSRSTADDARNDRGRGGSAEKHGEAKTGGEPGSGAGASAGVSPAAHQSLRGALAKSEKAGRGDPYKAGRDHLASARAGGALPTTEHQLGQRIAEGGEHHVELSTDRARVIKHTKGGLFGYQPDVNSTGNVILRTSTASEYMARNEAQNAAFGSDLQLEGSHAHDGGGLTYSQIYFTGTHPSPAEVDTHMQSKGFQKVSGDNIYDRTLEDTTYFNPASGYVVGDAKPHNFMKTADGQIHALDLMVVHAAPKTPLHTAMMKGIAR